MHITVFYLMCVCGDRGGRIYRPGATTSLLLKNILLRKTIKTITVKHSHYYNFK